MGCDGTRTIPEEARVALELTPIRLSDVSVGKPLPWPVFDNQRKLLLREGYVVETAAQAEQLIVRGLFRPVTYHRKPVARGGEAETGEAAANDSAPRAGQADDGPTLESLRPEIGSNVQLQPAGDDEKRYMVRLIGYIPGQCVLVTTPSVEGRTLLVREGQPYIFRGFHGTSAFAFSAHVLKSNNSPVPYLHLSYPRTVQGITVRKSTRVRTALIASVNRADTPDASPLAASVVDMSFTGCAMESPRPLGEVGERLSMSMRLKLDGPDIYINIVATIRSVRPPATPGGAIFHGVEFVSVAAPDRLALQNLVMSKIIAGEQAA